MSELLKFDITLSSTTWDKQPQYSILINDKVVVSSELLLPSPKAISFQHLVPDGEASLSIRLENKTKHDTIIVDGKIHDDMLLNIEDIAIDDIDLGQLLWDGEYILDEPQQYNGKVITQLNHCVNLGWNGTYRLNFAVPYYIWLLEKL